MANVKGPRPPGPRAPATPSRRGTQSARLDRTGSSTSKDTGQLLSDEDLAAAAGFARAHAAELEEEGRRHASGDAEAERRKHVEEGDDERVRGVAFDDERGRRQGRRPPDDEDTEDAEAANEAAKRAKDRGLVNPEGAGRYFRDLPPDRLGDPTLTDPDQMQRVLGPSVRFAQHAMLLADARMQQGAAREDALAFLADLYVRLGDRAYANKALRAFGPGTGILDLYPLELIDRLLEFVPGFCHRISRGAVLTSSNRQRYRAKAGQIIELSHDPGLRIRGFALKGGARPGYLLEPVDPPGRFNLVFLRSGRFTAIVSAIRRDGHLFLETFDCRIDEADDEIAELPGLEREREYDREADEVAAGDAPKPDNRGDLTIRFRRRI